MGSTYSDGSYRKYKKVDKRGRERYYWRAQITRTDEDGSHHNTTRILKDQDGKPLPCNPDGSRDPNEGQKKAEGALRRWRAELIAADEEEERAAIAAARREAERKANPLAGVTVSEFMHDYLSMLEGSGAVEKSTLTGYSYSVKRIDAALGDVLVTKLTTKNIQAWENTMRRGEGLSERTITKVHRLLSQALNAAVECGNLQRNPCKSVKLSKDKREKPHAMTRKQASDLLATLAAMPQTQVVSAARIALCSGMRIGEVCALRWEDVDVERRVLHVRRAIGRGVGGAYVKAPKNEFSVRDIPMVPQLRAALDARRERVLADAKEKEVMPSPEQLSQCYVVCDVDGRFVNPYTISTGWAQLRDLLGVTDADGHPLKFHDLRHTWATIAVHSGADIKSVSAIMGHADTTTTMNTYASSDEDARRLAAEKFSEYLGEPGERGEVKTFRKAAGE